MKNTIKKLNGFIRSVGLAMNGNPLLLPRALRSVLRARNIYDIGAPFYALYSLCRKPESEWKKYVTESKATAKLMKINPEYSDAITTDKIRFASHCRKKGMPTIPILCILDRRPDTDAKELNNAFDASMWMLVQRTLPSDIFIKLIDGAHGADAFAVKRAGDNWVVGETEFSPEELHRFLLGRLGERRGWIVQPIVRTHSELAEIMYPGSLGTIRIVTYLDRGNPRVMLPCLRIPARGNSTDNFSNGRSGNLVAAVDLESGVLRSARISASRTWPYMVSTDFHPDTGKIITGKSIPFWREIVQLVVYGQSVTPSPVTMGWDIAITQDGPVIVEANSLYSTDLLQVAYDRGIRPELESLINVVRGGGGEEMA